MLIRLRWPDRRSQPNRYSRRHGMWDYGAAAWRLIRPGPTTARPRCGPLAFDAVGDLGAEAQAGAIAQAALDPVERVVLQGPPQNLDGVSFVERFEETNDLRLIIGQRGFLSIVAAASSVKKQLSLNSMREGQRRCGAMAFGWGRRSTPERT
jgi:hypothetical protein